MPRTAVQTETLVSLSPIGISPKPETFSITNSLPPGTGNPAVAWASPGASWTATAIWNACLAGLSASRMLTPEPELRWACWQCSRQGCLRRSPQECWRCQRSRPHSRRL